MKIIILIKNNNKNSEYTNTHNNKYINNVNIL